GKTGGTGTTGGTTGGTGGTGGTGTTGGTTTATGLININTAPREVLLCLPGLTESDVDAMITQRESSVLSDPIDTTWAQSILAGKPGVAALVTGQSYQYSADIVAVSANGRAFKRVRVVIDIQSGTPKIIFRRDMTEFGWPLDPAILESLRSGNGVPGGSGTMDSSRRSS
ncbi:MAG TPA: type II secretion system protein GspK, partial [Tepidisphaeraceae bacterium]|nr:type II secretion system protein GspK [Tepidisphaeraceae bacterium]